MSDQPSWHEAPLHPASRNYDIPRFKAGRMTLRPFEIADVGDVRGKDLVHLNATSDWIHYPGPGSAPA